MALKELEPFIRDGEHLRIGRPFKRFGGLRSRELLANWLLCVAVNSVSNEERLTFSSDPLGGDGIIRDSTTEETWPTEHVVVPPTRDGKAADIETLILKAIELKRNKGGAAYATRKTLIVFLLAVSDRWSPNSVAKQLPEPLHFDAVWVVGLHDVNEDQYSYAVTRLDLSQGNAPIWVVHIVKDFDAWTVEPLQ